MKYPPRSLTVVAAALLLALFGISAGPPDQADRGLERAREVANEHAAGLLDISGIEGIGVGKTGGGAPVIRVYIVTPGVGGVPS